jgi:hypothetical protein
MQRASAEVARQGERYDEIAVYGFERAPCVGDDGGSIAKRWLWCAFDVDVERRTIPPRTEIDVPARWRFDLVLNFAASEKQSFCNETLCANGSHTIKSRVRRAGFLPGGARWFRVLRGHGAL